MWKALKTEHSNVLSLESNVSLRLGRAGHEWHFRLWGSPKNGRLNNFICSWEFVTVEIFCISTETLVPWDIFVLQDIFTCCGQNNVTKVLVLISDSRIFEATDLPCQSSKGNHKPLCRTPGFARIYCLSLRGRAKTKTKKCKSASTVRLHDKFLELRKLLWSREAKQIYPRFQYKHIFH